MRNVLTMKSDYLGPFFNFDHNILISTVLTHNSDTKNSDISQNSDTLFALTKMSLFCKEGISRKNTVIFFKH